MAKMVRRVLAILIVLVITLALGVVGEQDRELYELEHREASVYLFK